ncbi:DUF4391 domain-containing protein [Algoriphagus aquimarinus]|uniref:DUF4391 domain-containing protein n=1 Tax=Algoriphagus aquimarinus TaxID=237018 RepID=UPI0030DD8B0B
MRIPIEQLPAQTQFNRIVRKDMFDSYSTTQQRKLFTDNVERIRWTHKLFDKTTNLSGTEVKEIEIFQLDLRKQEGIEELVAIIDKAITSPILFVLNYKDHRKWMISKKHSNPQYENSAVIDWVFQSDWLTDKNNIGVNLKYSLDEVFKDLCLQLSPERTREYESIDELITHNREALNLTKKIEKLKSRIAKEKQFNRKVELNMKLEELEVEIALLKTK